MNYEEFKEQIVEDVKQELENRGKVMFNLTKRQLICFGLAALVGVPSFFLLKLAFSISTSVMIMMVIMMPSVIKPRKPSEREKRTVYPNRKSIRDKIREDIDLAMSKNPKDMNELLKFLEEMGYEIKRAKHIGLKGEEQKSFIRIDSLGAGYREDDFEKIFKGEEDFNPPPREKQSHRYEKPEKKFDMLLDIQEIIAKGKGPGYERWAKVHNIKQISQTLIFLRDHNIRDMDELAKLAY